MEFNGKIPSGRAFQRAFKLGQTSYLNTHMQMCTYICTSQDLLAFVWFSRNTNTSPDRLLGCGQRIAKCGRSCLQYAGMVLNTCFTSVVVTVVRSRQGLLSYSWESFIMWLVARLRLSALLWELLQQTVTDIRTTQLFCCLLVLSVLVRVFVSVYKGTILKVSWR